MIFRKIIRHRFICVALLLIVILIFVFKCISNISNFKQNTNADIFSNNDNIAQSIARDVVQSKLDVNQYFKCFNIQESNSTIKTLDTFSNFKFDDEWIKKRSGIWQDDFEKRYESLSKDTNRPPLKVFILPHSHNDPGWLKTFQGYFEDKTKKILDTMVTKLTQYKDMSFVWSEISFLDLWWQNASVLQKKQFIDLVNEGRLEIMTGGWVMTDEANVHLYAMLDQLIEGHQWVKSNLNILPRSAWSIDPFGQGSTVPHLLAKSGLNGAIIQRIHYSWKEYFARNQQSDFFWKAYWETAKSSDYTILTHNMPFDIYSTHHSCGPVPFTCDNFDFEKRPPNINDENIERNADQMYQQYAKLASLFPHNVAFVLVGGDFTYVKHSEFDNQYSGYKKLIEYINGNSKKYSNASLQFGTPSNYFDEIRKRQGSNFPSLVGDFFPYSDIFSSGTPAYWTGYFSTRPQYKFMSRKLEHNLRNAEILFFISLNMAKQNNLQENVVKKMEKHYESIILARRNLGLFQHHDAITGTSKLKTMIDYKERMMKSIADTISVQQVAIQLLMRPHDDEFIVLGSDHPEGNVEKKVYDVKEGIIKKIVIFNSLAQDRYEVLSIYTTSPHVTVLDNEDRVIKYQVNPTFDPERNFLITENVFEINFLIKISAMSIKTYKLSYDSKNFKNLAHVSCRNCERSNFFVIADVSHSIEIENSEFKLTFNESSGYLKSMKHIQYGETIKLELNFGGYKSAMRASGAYLFKPDARNSEYDNIFKDQPEVKIYVTKGEIASDVTVIRGTLLSHTIRIFNSQTYLDNALSIKNIISLGESNKNRDTEIVMRVNTDIANGKNESEPVFFTDLNSFQWQPRKAIPKLGVEGNYYPITSSVFIQDDEARLSLLTTHAQGATSFRKGQLEIMLDRRITYDDARGMGEGLMDNVRMEHQFLLTFEFFENSSGSKYYQALSSFNNHLANSLNYPLSTFSVEVDQSNKLNELKLFVSKFPCDTHIVNLRTLSESKLNWLPSKSALLILHRFGSDCSFNNEMFLKNVCEHGNDFFDNLQYIKNVVINKIEETSLTGLEDGIMFDSFKNETLEPMEIKSYKITLL